MVSVGGGRISGGFREKIALWNEGEEKDPAHPLADEQRASKERLLDHWCC
jgi:hypothetical protein